MPPNLFYFVLFFPFETKQINEWNYRKTTTILEVVHQLYIQITMATVNMAVRLWCTGDSDSCIPRRHFDILCVDEVWHVTETKIIDVAAILMRHYQDDGSTNRSSG